MKNLKELIKVSMKYWYLVLLGIISSMLFSVFSGVSIVMLKPLLDYIFQNRQNLIVYDSFAKFFSRFSQIFADFFNNFSIENLFDKEKLLEPAQIGMETLLKHSDPYMLLRSITVFILVSIILKNVFYFLQKTFYAASRGKTVHIIRNNMFETYLNQSLAYFNQNRVGDFLVRIVTDVKIINRDLLLNIFKIIHNTITSIVYLSIAILINYKLMLSGLVIIPIFGFLITKLGKKIKKYSKRLQRKASDLFSFVEEILNSMIIVKSYANEKYENKNFRKVNYKYYRYWFKGQIYDAMNRPLSEISSVLVGIIVFLIGGYQILNNPSGGFTFGDFSIFLGYIFMSLHPLKVIAKSYTKIRKGLVSLERVYEILNNDPEIKNSPNPIHKKDFENKIQIEDLGFAYEKNKPVLQNINLEINKGEQVAFVGSSGSGKTTLIKLLPRLYELNQGNIKIDGIPIKEIELSDLRNLFGVVTQKSHLFSKSIAYNISYSDPGITSDKKMIKASQIAYADEFIDKLDDKYVTEIQSKGSNFSGGQKQRISIARALYNNPPILIFDEATSALDTESEKKVQMAIENATQNHTVLVIAHRLSTVLKSDKIVVLDHGKIVGMGTHKELLDNCTKYQKLYNLQFA